MVVGSQVPYSIIRSYGIFILSFFSFSNALSLAETDLIFFIAAHMMLCFGFVNETVLIHWSCNYCRTLHAQCGDFLFLHCAPTVSMLGRHKRLRGDTGRTADLNSPKGYSILYDLMKCMLS